MLSKSKTKPRKAQIPVNQVERLEKIAPCLKPTGDVEDGIIAKIFGERQYKYKLCLLEPFEETLYKERNFSLGFKIIDDDGETILNSIFSPIQAIEYQ